MSTQDNGGPAFPRSLSEDERNLFAQQHQRLAPYSFEGMTLRDYFAAKAMAAWIATIPAENLADLEVAGKATFMQHASCVADIAYWYADAMLKARQQ